jgi:hypothetical protein
MSSVDGQQEITNALACVCVLDLIRLVMIIDVVARSWLHRGLLPGAVVRQRAPTANESSRIAILVCVSISHRCMTDLYAIVGGRGTCPGRGQDVRTLARSSITASASSFACLFTVLSTRTYERLAACRVHALRLQPEARRIHTSPHVGPTCIMSFTGADTFRAVSQVTSWIKELGLYGMRRDIQESQTRETAKLSQHSVHCARTRCRPLVDHASGAPMYPEGGRATVLIGRPCAPGVGSGVANGFDTAYWLLCAGATPGDSWLMLVARLWLAP